MSRLLLPAVLLLAAAVPAFPQELQTTETEHYLLEIRLLRDEAPGMDYLGAMGQGLFNVLHDSGEVETVVGAALTPGWFRHLPYRPVVGRLLLPEDGRAGARPVAGDVARRGAAVSLHDAGARLDRVRPRL